MTDDRARLDRTDQQILRELQANGRLPISELADKVSLTQSPCWRRVQMLERDGTILGYHALLSRARVGLGVHGFVYLRMEDHAPETAAAFERQVVAVPEVIACHNVSGSYDYQLEVVARDNEAFSRLIREQIRGLPGVRDMQTSVVFSEVKGSRALPLQP